MAASHDLLQRGPVLIEPPAALDGASGQFHRDSGEFRLSGTSRQALTAQANGQRYELLLATPPGPPPEAGFPVFLVLDADHLFATAVETLRPFKHIILVGSKPPVAFFAYPGKPSLLAQPDTQFHVLARPEEDIVHALEWLADELGARDAALDVAELELPGFATGAVTATAIGQSLCTLLPENAIVVDEGITASRNYFGPMCKARPHDWLQNMGGSIGIGPPMAVGAAIACPDRKVVALQADGSFMYTVQALWTQARENLDITTVVLANRAYAILRYELANVGASNVGRKALDMLDLGRPDIDWVSLARGMGVPGVRVETMEEVNRALERGLETRGPFLIEAVM